MSTELSDAKKRIFELELENQRLKMKNQILCDRLKILKAKIKKFEDAEHKPLLSLFPEDDDAEGAQTSEAR